MVNADVIVLTDGSRIEGDLKRAPDKPDWIITTSDGKVRTFPPDAVKAVELGGSTTAKAPLQAVDALSSLRRSVEALSDINQIIDRYQHFIASTKDETVQADAKSDLDVWRQRKESGLVKHGNRWVAPQELAALAAQASAVAEQARELIRQSRNPEADALLQQALLTDPSNPGAQYLRGVLLFRQDKFGDARKVFESVNVTVPSHPPTLNNLAVILWRQNQQPASLNYYDQAMQAAGVNDFILNNVAEALGSIPEDQRKGAPVARCLRRFSELDLVLQQRMAQQGLYRWGGGWIDQKKLDELKAAEKEIRLKLEAMQAEFGQDQSRISQIDADVSQNEANMDDLRLRSMVRDDRGNLVTLGLPGVYYDLQRENQTLRNEQNTLRSRLEVLQQQAKQMQQQVPVPRFTGIQQIVGVEGMPVFPDIPGPRATTATSRPLP